jgi:hypothetical protein
MSGLSFLVKTEEINAIANEFKANQIEIDKATRSALKETGNKLKTLIVKEVSSALGIIQAEIRRRIFVRLGKYGQLNAKVWTGENRISLIRFRSPRQTAGGAKAGKFFEESAFIAPIVNFKEIGFKEQIFRRAGRYTIPTKGKYLNKITKREGHRSGPAGSPLKREYLIVQRQEVEPIITAIIEKVYNEEAWNIFYERFRSKVKWQVTRK